MTLKAAEMLSEAVFLLFCVYLRTSAQVENCTSLGTTRIVNTSSFAYPAAGRVEVCYNRTWGTVGTFDTTPWNEKNAQVVCRSAGFDGAINSIFTNELSFEDRAHETVPVHFTVTSCTGSETNLTDCAINTDVTTFMSPGGTYNHLLDAFVVCRPDPASGSYSPVHLVGPLVGDFRLVGDSVNGRGAVEIFTRQFRWVSICPDGFDDSDAAALCTRLGYVRGNRRLYSVPNGGIGPLYLYDADCTETGANTAIGTSRISAGVCSFELNLQGCPTGSTEHAGIECFESSVSPGSVRLFEGNVLEVFYDGKWGMVCSGGSFDDTGASVVCGELGYHPPSSSWSVADSSQLEGESNLKPIWLSTVRCTEGVTRFSECGQANQLILGYGFCTDIVSVTCNPQFSSGEIAGIVIGVPAGLIVLFIIAWFAGLKQHWEKRHQNRHYRALANCCNSCKQRARRVQADSPRRQPEQSAVQIAEIRNPEPQEPPPPAASAPEPEPEPEGRELTKTAPPQYPVAIGFQQIAADLPPPYTEAAAPFPQ